MAEAPNDAYVSENVKDLDVVIAPAVGNVCERCWIHSLWIYLWPAGQLNAQFLVLFREIFPHFFCGERKNRRHNLCQCQTDFIQCSLTGTASFIICRFTIQTVFHNVYIERALR